MINTKLYTLCTTHTRAGVVLVMLLLFFVPPCVVYDGRITSWSWYCRDTSSYDIIRVELCCCWCEVGGADSDGCVNGVTRSTRWLAAWRWRSWEHVFVSVVKIFGVFLFVCILSSGESIWSVTTTIAKNMSPDDCERTCARVIENGRRCIYIINKI